MNGVWLNEDTKTSNALDIKKGLNDKVYKLDIYGEVYQIPGVEEIYLTNASVS